MTTEEGIMHLLGEVNRAVGATYSTCLRESCMAEWADWEKQREESDSVWLLYALLTVPLTPLADRLDFDKRANGYIAKLDPDGAVCDAIRTSEVAETYELIKLRG
jgi:hypothetical protein